MCLAVRIRVAGERLILRYLLDSERFRYTGLFANDHIIHVGRRKIAPSQVTRPSSLVLAACNRRLDCVPDNATAVALTGIVSQANRQDAMTHRATKPCLRREFRSLLAFALLPGRSAVRKCACAGVD